MAKSPIRRWYTWRYSGIITIGLLALTVYGGVMYLGTTGEFYDGWSCDLLIDYKEKDIRTSGFTMYDDLSELEQERYDNIIKDDCSLFSNK